METPNRICGNCVAWGAKDNDVASAACLKIPGGEDQFTRPILRMVNSMSTKPPRLATNVQLETPREFVCSLHQRPSECFTRPTA